MVKTPSRKLLASGGIGCDTPLGLSASDRVQRNTILCGLTECVTLISCFKFRFQWICSLIIRSKTQPSPILCLRHHPGPSHLSNHHFNIMKPLPIDSFIDWYGPIPIHRPPFLLANESGLKSSINDHLLNWRRCFYSNHRYPVQIFTLCWILVKSAHLWTMLPKPHNPPTASTSNPPCGIWFSKWWCCQGDQVHGDAECGGLRDRFDFSGILLDKRAGSVWETKITWRGDDMPSLGDGSVKICDLWSRFGLS